MPIRTRSCRGCAGCGRLPRAWRRGDDPAHPSRPPHRLEQGRLAAGAGALAGARTGASRLSQRRSRTGTSSASSPTMPRPPSACRPPASTASRSRPTAICSDGFWSPATNHRDDEYGGCARQPAALHAWCSTPCARRSARRSSSASAWSPTRIGRTACRARRGIEIASGSWRRGKVDFLNIIRGQIETDAALTTRDPDDRHARGAASRLRRRGAGGDEIPGLPRGAHQRRRDRPPRDRRAASSTWSA